MLRVEPKGASTMVLMLLERVTPSLRGELSRWLIQPRTGVFVGTVSSLVRDKLWEKIVASLQRSRSRTATGEPGAVMIYTTNNEQGFEVRVSGETNRRIEDFEGLILVKSPNSA